MFDKLQAHSLLAMGRIEKQNRKYNARRHELHVGRSCVDILVVPYKVQYKFTDLKY